MHIGIEPLDILANALEIIYYSIDIIQAQVGCGQPCHAI